ncbi:MAG: hypothetical protein ABR518_03120, partial [Actinomycetota bacterium]
MMGSPAGRHDHLEELIAAEALGGIDELDRQRLERELAAHGPDCEECGRLLTEYGEAAANLALALEPVPLSPGAEVRLVQLARAGTEGRTPGGERSGEERVRALPVRPRGVRRWVAPAAVAATLV